MHLLHQQLQLKVDLGWASTDFAAEKAQICLVYWEVMYKILHHSKRPSTPKLDVAGVRRGRYGSKNDSDLKLANPTAAW